MRKTSTLALFLFVAALPFLASGCVRQQAAQQGQLPKWLTDNVRLVETSIEGTVLIDASPRSGEVHHGGVGIVLDSRHVLLPAHSVSDTRSVQVHPRSFYVQIPGFVVGDPVQGTLKSVQAHQDAALFETAADLPSTPLRLVPGYRPQAGQHVWYFGKRNGFRPCTVSAASVEAGLLKDAIQVGIDAADGDSGAPLVTDDGIVVGMLYATSTDNKRTYFVPIDKALAAVGWR